MAIWKQARAFADDNIKLLLILSEKKKDLEKFADAVDQYIRTLVNENKQPKEHIRELCALTPDAVDEVSHSVDLNSPPKRPRKRTAIIEESEQQQEELSPKKKKTQKSTKQQNKQPSRKALAKKAEQVSAIHGGMNILNSLPMFQANFPSTSSTVACSSVIQPTVTRSSSVPCPAV